MRIINLIYFFSQKNQLQIKFRRCFRTKTTNDTNSFHFFHKLCKINILLMFGGVAYFRTRRPQIRCGGPSRLTFLAPKSPVDVPHKFSLSPYYHPGARRDGSRLGLFSLIKVFASIMSSSASRSLPSTTATRTSSSSRRIFSSVDKFMKLIAGRFHMAHPKEQKWRFIAPLNGFLWVRF